MSQPIRPCFMPLPCLPDDPWEPLKITAGGYEWVPVCSCPAGFPIETFNAAVTQMVHHPEYNSTLILRSEIIEESQRAPEPERPQLENFRFVKNIHRRLLPRRPGRDPPIEQDCTFYSVADGAYLFYADSLVEEDQLAGKFEAPVTCLVLTPKLEAGVQMPYYHPAVFHIAFRYLHSPTPPDSSTHGEYDNTGARLRIEVVLQPGSPDPKDVNSRLYRTCLSLLETVHRYGWGLSTNYRKQAHHDCVVSREEYQDLYLIMRERHKHLIDQWHENTDPLKHVFEDIGIATFLMLLWKHDTQEIRPSLEAGAAELANIDATGENPWMTWSRPRGGFLDFGCGNGLLVHILTCEGYIGEGIDLRARTSWQHYPPETQVRLHVHALDPLDLPISPSRTMPVVSSPFFKEGTFIIANHADELSPWTPLLATLTRASGFLSIPCCPWSFDSRFERAQMPLHRSNKTGRIAGFSFSPPQDTDPDDFVDALHLGGMGGDARKSTYAAYRVWLACLGIRCGWAVETETLRIPSTRNWALVGRQRCDEELDSVENALDIIHQVRERGLFKTRRPEGKAADH